MAGTQEEPQVPSDVTVILPPTQVAPAIPRLPDPEEPTRLLEQVQQTPSTSAPAEVQAAHNIAHNQSDEVYYIPLLQYYMWYIPPSPSISYNRSVLPRPTMSPAC